MPRKTDSNNPSDWLWIAEAELIRTGWGLEKTHDLERLLGEMTARKNDLASSFEPLCESLAEVYFSGRYPGFDFDEPDWSGLQSKLTVAEKLLETVKGCVARSLSSSTPSTGKA